MKEFDIVALYGAILSTIIAIFGFVRFCIAKVKKNKEKNKFKTDSYYLLKIDQVTKEEFPMAPPCGLVKKKAFNNMIEFEYSNEFYNVFGEISKIADNNKAKLEILKKGDDWSFIIKCIALVESSLNRLLTSKTKDKKFEKFFSKMSISNKLNIAYELELFTSKKEKNFIEYLIKLRNKLAHDPNEMEFNFSDFFLKMTEDEKNIFKDHMKIDSEDKNEEYYNFIFEYPKEGISIILNSILSVFAFYQEFNKIDNSTFKGGRTILSDLVDEQMVNTKEQKLK